MGIEGLRENTPGAEYRAIMPKPAAFFEKID